MHRKNRLTDPLRLLLILFLFLSSPLQAQQEDEFLQPQEAFKLEIQGTSPKTLELNWKITPGYYLYRNKTKISSESDAISLGEVVLPEGETKDDEFFGKVEIYHQGFTAQVPLQRAQGDGDTLKLKTVVQGCAEDGICYPPLTQHHTVALQALPENMPALDERATGDPLATLMELGNQLDLEEPKILSPEEAYLFNANVVSGDKLQLNWDIAEGTYLYQDKIKINLEGNGVALGDYQLPPADIKKDALRPDGSIGDMLVYHNRIELPLPLQRSKIEATQAELKISFQGCAEAGVCYPPIKKLITLDLPAVATATATSATERTSSRAAAVSTSEPQTQNQQAAAIITPEALSEQDKIAATLAGGSVWLIILSFFVFGILLSLTPCVFPMIPILSGIIAGQGSSITTRRAFTLSLIYVLAMAVTYTLAGILAGLFGQNLQAAFQNPWILSSFAVIFVLLALSMFGFYELQLPNKWQSRLTEASNKQKGGSLTGVAVMGLLSALIVGPCVAPPLAGALIFIGQTGDWQLGGLALFFMAMGMGAPLIILGTSAGKLLPRAGKWMDTVKAVFGVGMLAVAIILLERIIPAAVAMFLWGGLLIVSAVYMGALRELPIEASGWSKLWKGIGFVLLIYGALMLVGVAAGGKDTVQPLRGLSSFTSSADGTAVAQHLSFKRIKSVDDLQREVASAKASEKPVMLDFYADWCVSCKELERYTFSDPQVISELSEFVLLQADVTADDETDRALLQGHFGLPGPPGIMFYGRDGIERKAQRIVGFLEAEEFLKHVQATAQ